MFVGSLPLLGVLLALISAFVLAVGNLWQSRGMKQVSDASTGSATGSVWSMLKNRTWLAGTAFFGIAILLQMVSLAFAPLILVQPVGVAALVFTSMLTARASGQPATPLVKKAIGITLIGVVSYVIIAAIVSKQQPITDNQLIEMLVTLLGVIVVAVISLFAAKGAARAPMLYVVLGGVFSGFVATLGKTVILRVESMFKGGHFDFGPEGWLTVLCVIGIGVAAALSTYFVQFSHTCNSPESVIAGLTVIDPAVAVILGITILQEAAGAPMWTTFAFLLAGGVSFVGVWKLAQAENPSPPKKSTPSKHPASAKTSISPGNETQAENPTPPTTTHSTPMKSDDKGKNSV